MANALFLLQPNFNFNSLLHQTFHFPPLHSPPTTLSSGDHNAFKLNYTLRYKVIRGYPKLRIKCFSMTPKPKVKNGIGGNEVVWISIKNVLKALQKPVITGVLLLGLLLMYDQHHGCVAFAAPTKFEGVVGVEPAVGAKRASIDGSELILPIVSILLGLGVVCLIVNYVTEETSVVKLQVGMSGTGRTLQRDLNWIAGTANTYTPEGLSYVLQETTLALIRRPEYCISGYSSVYMKRSIQKVENRFNQLSIEERYKRDVETLININNIGKQCVTTQRSKDFCNDYIVITIIVAAGGTHILPPINSSADLKEALIKLATIPPSRVKAVAVFVTPQSENDTLTEQNFLEDYAVLRPL